MPQLSDLVQKRKFVKKEYRPWDLSGSGTVDGKEVKDQIKSDVAIQASVEVEEKINVNVPVNQIDEPKITPSEVIKLTGNETDNDSDTNQVTIRKQRVNNKVTTGSHKGNIEVSTREQLDNKIDNIIGNTDNLAYLIGSVKKLAGLQKNIFYYVISLCSARGALDTGSILSNDLANTANCSIGSAKTSLIRLIEKKLILRLQGKASRGGHIVLGITKEIQAAAIQAQQALFNPYRIATTDNITGNNTNNINSYSSSNKYINTTTSLPDEWKKINFELLAHIGFCETQLNQLCKTGMTSPEIVQDAINRFAYSLEHSDKVKAYGDPLNVLMGVLRKGQRWNEPNYISPKELAMRQILDEKRKRKEQYDAIIKELVDLEFPTWKKKLSDDEIKKIVPEHDLNLKMHMTAATQAALRMYFIENVLSPQFDIED